MDRGIATDYRRRARRLRHVFSSRPIELHRQLRRLSAECSPSTPTPAASPTAEPVKTYEPDSKARLFACFVKGATDGSVIRYSKRQQLLRVAAQLGIKRFEANLLIAAVEHSNSDAGVSPAICKTNEGETPSPLKTMLAVVFTQAVIVAGAWWMFCG